MTKIQRIRTIFESLMLLLCAALLFLAPDKGYQVIVRILSIVLIVNGMRYLIFYFAMARNMVDGKLILFYGIIALDLGLLAYTLQNIPPIYIVLYLLITHLFSGVVDVLRAMEARRLGSRWRLNIAIGAANGGEWRRFYVGREVKVKPTIPAALPVGVTLSVPSPLSLTRTVTV